MTASDFHGKPVVPDSIKHLDADVLVEVLSRHGVNVTEAADELGVASADLRRLLWARPQLVDAAAEIEERRLDLAERNIYEALKSDDPRRRDAASMFTIRNSHRARKRGWITTSTSAAELSVNVNADQPRTITFRWRSSDDPPATDEFERDGRTFAVPRYGGSDPVDGELAMPPVLIEPPEPPQLEPIPEPPQLPKWSGPGGPPPLVAHLYQPWSPPKQQRREPEDHPQPEPWRRMSRGGYR
jgi:hypothetical protein